MPNADYKDDDAGELAQKVKGSKGEAPSFASTSADKDDQKADLNNSGVKMPQDSAPKL